MMWSHTVSCTPAPLRYTLPGEVSVCAVPVLRSPSVHSKHCSQQLPGAAAPTPLREVMSDFSSTILYLSQSAFIPGPSDVLADLFLVCIH